MSTSAFPGSLDTYQNPSTTSPTNNPSLSYGQTLQNDSLAALEAAVGVTGSAVSTSLTYQVNALKTYAQSILVDSGGANAYVLAPSPAVAAYAAGQQFTFVPSAANTGATTLNVSGLGTKAVQYLGTALVSGVIQPTVPARVIYDGTYFQLVNPFQTNLLGYAQIISSYTASPGAGLYSPVTGLTVTVTVPPGGRRVRVETFANYVQMGGAGNATTSIAEGSTVLASSGNTIGGVSGIANPYAACVLSPSVGTHTYFVQLSPAVATSITLAASPALPAFILVTLI